MARSRCLGVLVGLAAVAAANPARADQGPERWEQLFFPYPIVGAPPQLEQQAQLFSDTFEGPEGGGQVLSLELAYILSPRWGLVLGAPYQLGFRGQSSGFGDLEVLAQYLVAGSIRADNMLSAGILASFPTAQHGLGSGDYDVGPFAFAAQRFWDRLTLGANVTALLPVTSGQSTRRILSVALLSVLVTPLRFRCPIFLQTEVDSATYLGGTAALPPGATRSPAQTVFIAPEILVGPFRTWLSGGTRLIAGVFFNLHGDSVHARTYSLAISFDIPNPYGY